MQSDDPYCYPGTNVLKNHLNLRNEYSLDQHEKLSSMLRMINVFENTNGGKFDYDHLKNIHKEIFGGIYPFAGQERTIGITKPEPLLGGASVRHPSPVNYTMEWNLTIRAEQAFKALADDKLLTNLPRRDFVEKMSTHGTELWVVHPFREGNTRSIYTFLISLAKNSGFSMTTIENRQRADELRNAFVHATTGNRKELHAILDTLIDRGVKIAEIANKPERKQTANELSKVYTDLSTLKQSEFTNKYPDIGSDTYAKMHETMRYAQSKYGSKEQQVLYSAVKSEHLVHQGQWKELKNAIEKHRQTDIEIGDDR